MDINAGPAAAARTRWEIVFLTIPQLGLMLCHLTISMTDVWVAGHIDATVLAVLAIINQIYTFLMLLISLVGSGCMASVSQALGSGRHTRASRYGALIIAISFLAGSLVASVALLGQPLIFHFFHIQEEMRPVIVVFITAYAAQLPFYYSMIMFNAVFRAYKLVWLPLLTLALVTLVNFVGSVGFGLGKWGCPQIGYAAVAWSTFFSTVLGFFSNVVLASSKKILTRVSFGPWRWNRVAAPRLWHVGAPAALGNIASHLGSLFLLSLLADLPRDALEAVGGMTIGSRILSCLAMPLNALAMTITILSGHLIGGKKSGQVHALGRKCALWTALGMIFAAALLIFFREPLAAIFANDSETVHFATVYMIPACCALPFMASTQMLGAVLAGAGATRILCWVSCVSVWGISVPVSWLLGYWQGIGALGIYIGMALGSVSGAVLTIFAYEKRTWQKCRF